MQKKYFLPFLLLVSIVLVLFSCTNNSKPVDVEVIKVDVSSPEEFLFLEDITDFEEFKFVPLETNENCLVGSVNSIKLLDSTIFIGDEDGNAVHAFDLNGKHLRTLNKIGRGHGEYIGMTDFEILEDENLLVVADNYGEKILFYDLNTFEYKDVFQWNGEVWANYLAKLNNELYLFNDASSTNGYFHLFKLKNKEYTKYFHFEDCEYGWGLDKNILARENDFLMHFTPYDTIYSFDGENATAKYFVDFGDKKAPASMIELGHSALAAIIKSDYISGVNIVKCIKDNLLIFADDRNNEYITSYSLKDKTVKTAKFFTAKNNIGMASLDEFNLCKDCILFHINTDTFKSMVDPNDCPDIKSCFTSEEIYNNFMKIGKNLKDFDNPVICYAKIK